MANLGAQRRQARLDADYTGVPILSDTMYNMVLGGVVMYGLCLSALMCVLLRPYVFTIAENYTVIMIAYFVCAIAGICMSAFSSNAIISFVGYNLVVVPMGIVLSMVVYVATEIDISIVMQSLIYTMLVTFCMIILSIVNPEFFLGLGGLLFSVLTGLVLSGLVCWIFHWSTAWQGWIGVVLFSLYIGYDFQRSQQFEKTMDNAVDCAMDIYLDIINLFIRILQIMASSKSSNRGRRR